jgi:hypothetical protein
LEIRHLAVYKLRPPHRERLVHGQVHAFQEKRELPSRVVLEVPLGVKRLKVPAHARGIRPRGDAFDAPFKHA